MVWYKVWKKIGLTDEEIRSYFTGPVYLPWHRMANIDGWNGPLPMQWLESQAELQKKILARERELNMTPVLPAFAGHVPAALKRIHPDANIQYLGKWAGFGDSYRCHFLNPEEPLFAEIQKSFLEEQEKMFGTDHIYVWILLTRWIRRAGSPNIWHRYLRICINRWLLPTPMP